MNLTFFQKKCTFRLKTCVFSQFWAPSAPKRVVLSNFSTRPCCFGLFFDHPTYRISEMILVFELMEIAYSIFHAEDCFLSVTHKKMASFASLILNSMLIAEKRHTGDLNVSMFKFIAKYPFLHISPFKKFSSFVQCFWICSLIFYNNYRQNSPSSFRKIWLLFVVRVR